MRSSDETISSQVPVILMEVAERIVVPRFGALTEDDVEEKKPGDLVTIADKQAEEKIETALRMLTPQALIVGEEHAFTAPEIMDDLSGVDEAWVIDPIDGTRNFTKSSPDFAIMVAHVLCGEVTESWIYQPMHDAMYHAERGAGVRRNGQPVRRHSERARLLGAAYLRINPLPGSLDLRRSWGACGIDYPKLVEGEIDFLLYREGKPWDHLPGALMVAEMGGRTAIRTGQCYRPGISAAPLSVIPANQWEHVRDVLGAN